MALTRAEVEALVRRFAERVREHIPVDEVWVYGSYAIGTPTDDSDIDVAVISPAFADHYWDNLEVLGRARDPDAFLIEPLGFPTHHRESPARGSFLEEILKTGFRVPV
jgi:predicted nucleotidyltransferase